MILYLKGDKAPSVYAFDPATGDRRPVDLRVERDHEGGTTATVSGLDAIPAPRVAMKITTGMAAVVAFTIVAALGMFTFLIYTERDITPLASLGINLVGLAIGFASMREPGRCRRWPKR